MQLFLRQSVEFVPLRESNNRLLTSVHACFSVSVEILEIAILQELQEEVRGICQSEFIIENVLLFCVQYTRRRIRNIRTRNVHIQDLKYDANKIQIFKYLNISRSTLSTSFSFKFLASNFRSLKKIRETW